MVFGQKNTVCLDKMQFCASTGLSAVQVDEAVKLQLLLPREVVVFDSEDLAVGHMLALFNKFGYPFQELRFYPRYAIEIVQNEIAIQQKIIKGQSYDQALAATLELTRFARILRGYIIDRVFQQSAERQNLVCLEKKELPEV